MKVSMSILRWLCLPHVQLAEAVEPEGHKLRADLGLRQLFAGKPVLKLVAAVFQLLQPRLCGARQDALLDGAQQIADGGVRLTELLLIQWLPILQPKCSAKIAPTIP